MSLSFLEEADQLANPEHNGCTADNTYPVGKSEWYDIEKLSPEFHYKDLTDKDHQCYQGKSSAFLKMECGSAGLEGAGVKHVPELKEDEDSKEQRQFILAESGIRPHRNYTYLFKRGNIGMLEVVKKSEQQEEEDTAYTDN